MDLMQIDFESQEAMDILSEIVTIRDNILTWCTKNVAQALECLYSDWQKVCDEFDSLNSDIFSSKAKILIQDCCILENQISQKSKFFEDIVEDRLPAIRILSANKTEIKSLTEDILTRWNAKDKEQLISFYERIEELETRIRELANI